MIGPIASERRYRLRVEEPGDDEAWYTSWFEKESHVLAALREYRAGRFTSGTRWQIIGQTVVTNEEVLAHGVIH